MIEEKIRYSEEKAWEKYFREDLVQLYTSVSAVLKARDLIIEQISDKFVGELIQENSMWIEVFFGGMRSDGKFEENALAVFYRDCFGIKISEDLISKVVSRIKEGLSLESASDDVKPSIESTPIVELLTKIKRTLGIIFKQLEVDKPNVRVNEISDSRFGVSLLGNVLNSGKRLLPLYNPLSFFIVSVYSVPKFYVKEIYTKLFDEEAQKVLEKYDIRISDLIYPDLPDEKIRTERSVIGLEKDCVGWEVYRLILMLYQLFQDESLMKFFSIEDEFNKYLKVYAEKLRESIVTDKFSDVIKAIGKGAANDRFHGMLKIQGSFRKYPYWDDKGTIEGGNIKIGSHIISYSKFMAFMAPMVFLGFGYIRPISAKEFSWSCILGWES